MIMMKSSEVIKRVIESDMPDQKDVRGKCIEELHKGKAESEKTDQKKSNRKMRKTICAGLGACAIICLCLLNIPASSDAESFIARLQTWLHLNHERVSIGEMKKEYIRIPDDCETVEDDDETYLAKTYSSIEELEKDIGKHLDIWRGGDAYRENGILLRIVDGKYANIALPYDLSKGENTEYANRKDQIQGLKCCITIPLSEDFSMNTIKLKDQFLKNAVLDEKGNLISYSRNSDYSIIETYHSEHLDINISVIEDKRMTDIDSGQEDITDYHYYYLYFVHQGLSYQINCNSNLETAKSVVEELE